MPWSKYITPIQTPDNGPNYQLDDALVAIKSLLGLTDFTKSQQFSEKYFTQKYKPSKFAFVSQGRQALYLILSSLNLPPNSEIILQGLSCIVVPNSVVQAGYKPIIADIDPQTLNIDPVDIKAKITAKTKAIIVQHNFGISADMKNIIELCQKYNLLLIEDCAHSLGLKYEFQGKIYPAGSLGQAVIFSFSRDKAISTTSGGAVMLNSKLPWKSKVKTDQFTQDLEAKIHSLKPAKVQKAWINLIYVLLTTLLIRPFYNLYLGKAIAQMNKKFKFGGQIYTQAEKNTDISNFPKPEQFPLQLYPLLWNQLQKLDLYASHRQKIAKIYEQELQIQRPRSSYNRFPIVINQLFPTQNPKKIKQKILLELKNINVFAGSWYTQAFEGSDSKGLFAKPKNIPQVESMVKHNILNLPTDIHISPQTARKVTKTILKIKNELTEK